MNKDKLRELTLDFVFVAIGGCMGAFAITSILRPSGLVTGGIVGLSIIIENIIKVNYTYIYYFMSILILICARYLLGKKDAARIIFLSLSFPLMMMAFERLNLRFLEGNDLVLSSMYYGIINGIGCGLILKRGFSFGGSDTMAKIFHRRVFPFISMSQILLFIDTIIIITSIFVFDKNIALYAILTQLVFTKSVNTVLFGFGYKKVKIEIVSNEKKQIGDYILNTIKRGYTCYTIKGGYTGEEKETIVSVCTPREALLIKKFISDIDSTAFVYVTATESVWGEGIGFESIIDVD